MDIAFFDGNDFPVNKWFLLWIETFNNLLNRLFLCVSWIVGKCYSFEHFT